MWVENDEIIIPAKAITKYSPHQLNISKDFSKLNCFDFHHLQNQGINLGKSSNKDTNLFTFQGWGFQIISLFNAFACTTTHVEFKTESDERSLTMWSDDLGSQKFLNVQSATICQKDKQNGTKETPGELFRIFGFTDK